MYFTSKCKLQNPNKLTSTLFFILIDPIRTVPVPVADPASVYAPPGASTGELSIPTNSPGAVLLISRVRPAVGVTVAQAALVNAVPALGASEEPRFAFLT